MVGLNGDSTTRPVDGRLIYVLEVRLSRASASVSRRTAIIGSSNHGYVVSMLAVPSSGALADGTSMITSLATGTREHLVLNVTAPSSAPLRAPAERSAARAPQTITPNASGYRRRASAIEPETEEQPALTTG